MTKAGVILMNDKEDRIENIIKAIEKATKDRKNIEVHINPGLPDHEFYPITKEDLLIDVGFRKVTEKSTEEGHLFRSKEKRKMGGRYINDENSDAGD